MVNAAKMVQQGLPFAHRAALIYTQSLFLRIFPD
jgi:hypothetical protein